MSSRFKYQVKVRYSSKMDTIDTWDQVCIYAIERFGLPGKNYITEVTADEMIWFFEDSRNALMFKLRFSGVAS